METKEIIETFFKEEVSENAPYFFYKDKQLLKEGRYIEFAEEQIQKAKSVALSIAGFLLMASWFGITNLIEYGTEPHWWNLFFGLFLWFAALGVVLLASKEYYSVKSSMNLLMKMLKEEEKTE